MRRAVTMAGGTALGVALLLSLKPHHSTAQAAPVAAPSDAPSAAGPAAASSGSPGMATAAARATGKGTGVARAGGSPAAQAPRVVTGATAETQYGPVQVAIHVSGKRITAVDVLQHPSASERSQSIAAMSLPVLTREAIAAQSAHIDAVSGASYTSSGYEQSLQSAIDRAGLA
jgi:uncharacterized protein with FMN-binding domain